MAAFFANGEDPFFIIYSDESQYADPFAAPHSPAAAPIDYTARSAGTAAQEPMAPFLSAPVITTFRPCGTSSSGGRVTAYALEAECIAEGSEIPSAVNPWARVTRLTFESGESFTGDSIRVGHYFRTLERASDRAFRIRISVPAPQTPGTRVREVEGVFVCYLGEPKMREARLRAHDPSPVRAGPFVFRALEVPAADNGNRPGSNVVARVAVRQDSTFWAIQHAIAWYITFSDGVERRAYINSIDGSSKESVIRLYYPGDAVAAAVTGVRAEWLDEPPGMRTGRFVGRDIALTTG
jgi:hypothetical protein